MDYHHRAALPACVIPSPLLLMRIRLIALAVIASLGHLARAEQPPVYEREVRPILAKHCFRCHGEQSAKAELDLSSPSGVLKGGESGQVIAQGKADESLLYELVLSGDMPPAEDKQLSKAEVATIAAWIAGGAKFAEEAHVPGALSQHDVLPILHRRCVMCHGPEYRMGDFDVRSKSSLLAGGVSGPALLPGEPNRSPMVLRVRNHLCPPQADIGEAGIEPMTSEERATLVEWIDSGAPVATVEPAPSGQGDLLVSDADRDFWSFRPPTRPPLPGVKRRRAVRTPVDAFLLARLESDGLAFAAEADRLTLLRRVTFALTGLPPAADEVAQFMADDAAGAYERLVDRLLASPRYGERWGRFWLDLAGYADSEGKRHADTIRPFAWRYRDYVIRSFNRDKPFDTFLMEQLAGDELVDYANSEALSAEALEKLVATGFLRMAPDGTSADPVNRLSDRVEVIADEIDVLGRGVLGLTLRCARCHSHKYDPIPQRDYYRLVAVFKGAYDEYDWLTPQPFGNQWKLAKQRHLEVILPEEAKAIAEHNAPLEKAISTLRSQQDAASDKQQLKKLSERIKQLEAELRRAPKIRALWDRGRPSPTYVYRRGVETQPGRLVEPGVPAVLTDGKTPFAAQPLNHSTPKTGRRLAFAKWLTQPNHPLTARVIVNRIWHQHFGQGIVKSIDNFGKLGTPPSHPELLDWLAVEFVESGWSVMHLHRLIVNSTAYRQSSTVSELQAQLDPENRLVSRMPMRRLSAEEVRDSILFVSDRLSGRRFGEPSPVDVRQDGLVTSKEQGGRWRRSIYVRQRRKEMPTILETFDLPQMNPNCTQRMDSTVVSQPLHLLNNRMVYDLSRSFAERVARDAGLLPRANVERAWLLAYGRPASEDEGREGVLVIRQLTESWQREGMDELQAARNGLADFCHVLLNSAAFLYVD